jgi:CheY-like chemotaxis protein
MTPYPTPDLLPPSDPISAGSLRVLVVDDSPTARVLLRHLLRRLAPSAEVLEAAEGKGALRLLCCQAVDLVVCDLHMPGMDGASFLQLLRRNSLLRNKAVLVVTGSPEDVGPDLVADRRARILAKPLEEPALRAGMLALLR